MSPGRKKRFLQNEYRKDKVVDSSKSGNLCVASDEVASGAIDALNDESKDEDLNKERASFRKHSKRKVVSNWNRYDETPDAESEELRGADYEVALTCSSGVVSQFRFEAEKEWEDESLQIDASDFTSIDCNALASALACIPFHERLGITEDVFEPEKVEEFCATAADHRRIYVPPKRSAGSGLSNKESTSESKLQNEINTTILESLTSCLSIKNESNSVEKETKHLEKAAQKKVIDTELDFLLSLSENKEKDSVPEKIESLLQGDSVQPATQTKPCKSPAVPSSEINIDDWLDSIVDDD